MLFIFIRINNYDIPNNPNITEINAFILTRSKNYYQPNIPSNTEIIAFILIRIKDFDQPNIPNFRQNDAGFTPTNEVVPNYSQHHIQNFGQNGILEFLLTLQKKKIITDNGNYN
ncbi:MAG: hypothetical protein PUC14_05565 [Bacteroidales bacterium]|nr:hypothetical protein [Bacteroidales bacterium]MDD5975179.1 hypothetical protein [Bacteroidales bacterium]MDY5193911.1 hypothetical protein [Candidatus Aphodosoma sp.]